MSKLARRSKIGGAQWDKIGRAGDKTGARPIGARTGEEVSEEEVSDLREINTKITG